ncbi:MAG: hypothetical protein IJZ30_01775 [Alphaproteobacteria bacterium]|nr:hypothetical protein [Alphaproteobacteria bacterium]
MKNKILDITTPKGPIKCYNMLREKGISPELCIEILSSTKNTKVTEELLKAVDKEVTSNPQEYTKYREILVFIINRKHSTNINDKVANIVINSTNIDTPDKFDKKIITYLGQENLSKDMKKRMDLFVEEFIKKNPTQVEDVAEDIVDYIADKKGRATAREIVEDYVFPEISPKNKRNIFSKLLNKIKAR